MPSIPRTLILMGVCGCGKSLIGTLLAENLGGIFEDADDFHPAPNKAKMTAGIPLNDDDRWPWLRILRERIVEMRSQTPCYLLACSALRQVYRDILRGGDTRETLEFIHLSGSRELIGARMAARRGHYMPTSLIDSQFAILEPPLDAMTVDISGTPHEITQDILDRLGQHGA
jgi:gluconokinase